jgi:hypothetical protein
MSHVGRFIPTLTLIGLCAATTPCAAQDHASAPELSFWTVGSGGVAARFGTDLYQTLDADKVAIDLILLTISEQPLAEYQILERTGLSNARLLNLIAKLDALHLISKDGDNRWATTVPVITDDQMRRIRQSLTPLARGVAHQVRDDLPRLIALYDRVKSPLDPAWESVAHLIVDKFIIDGTFHSAIGRIERERGARQYYSQAQDLIPAFFIERGENFSTFGSNWYPFTEGDAQREVYVLHGALFNRYDIRMNAYRGDPEMSAALFGITPTGRIESLAENERDILRALDWIEDGRLLVPLVQASTIKSLWPRLEEIGAEAADVVFDNHSIIVDAFNSSPYSRFLDAGGDYFQACYHALFGVVLEQLAETGAVPELPNPVPEHFGVYIVMGKLF